MIQPSLRRLNASSTFVCEPPGPESHQNVRVVSCDLYLGAQSLYYIIIRLGKKRGHAHAAVHGKSESACANCFENFATYRTVF